MNKAFVREPEPDGRAFCPGCGSLGTAVGKITLDHQVQSAWRATLGDEAWFCSFARCQVAHFDLFERVVMVGQLQHAIYPKDSKAPICACFGFAWDDVDAAIDQQSPASIRELLEKSKSTAARCAVLAADGRCCLSEVKRLYIRGINSR